MAATDHTLRIVAYSTTAEIAAESLPGLGGGRGGGKRMAPKEHHEVAGSSTFR
jgi:hypothetical protein